MSDRLINQNHSLQPKFFSRLVIKSEMIHSKYRVGQGRQKSQKVTGKYSLYFRLVFLHDWLKSTMKEPPIETFPKLCFCFCIYLPWNLLNNPISHQMEHIFPSKK